MNSILGIFELLFTTLFARFTPTRKTEWSILYRGSFSDRDGHEPLLSVTGDMMACPFCHSANHEQVQIAAGQPGVALLPGQALHVKVFHDGNMLSQTIELEDLFGMPLLGKVFIMADRKQLKVRVDKYTWGHSVSFDTGQQHRSTRMLGSKTLEWQTRPASAEDIRAAGLAPRAPA
jgi:hypothetical protein